MKGRGLKRGKIFRAVKNCYLYGLRFALCFVGGSLSAGCKLAVRGMIGGKGFVILLHFVAFCCILCAFDSLAGERGSISTRLCKIAQSDSGEWLSARRRPVGGQCGG